MNLRKKNSGFMHYARSLGSLACCLYFVHTYAETVTNNTAQTQKTLEFSDYSAPAPIDTSIIQEPTDSLALPQALALALIRSPKLAAFSQEIRAREAVTLQAGLFPNPVFNVGAANFANNTFQGHDGPSVTLTLSQLVELGGKRAARIETATLNHSLANWDYETQRINVLTQATLAYINVLTAQKRLQLLQHKMDLADQIVKVASSKVRAGSVIPLEETKAKVIRASAQIERVRAERELIAARKILAASWGSTEPHFESVAGDLENIQKPPALSVLIQRLKQNPDLARWATEINQRQAVLNLEKSKAIPNITLSLGTNAYLDGNNYNMNAGLSVPLPLFNRNQGSILAAEYRLTKVEHDRRDAEVAISTALSSVYQQLKAAYTEVTTLRAEVVPGAESAFAIASRGYRLGEFAFLDVLDAQRTLFDVKAQYLQAQAGYHLNVANIERLIGGALHSSSLGSTNK